MRGRQSALNEHHSQAIDIDVLRTSSPVLRGVGVVCSFLGGVFHCPTTRSILVPQPGMEPQCPASEGRFLTMGSPRKATCFQSFTSVLMWVSGLQGFIPCAGSSQPQLQLHKVLHIVYSQRRPPSVFLPTYPSLNP